MNLIQRLTGALYGKRSKEVAKTPDVVTFDEGGVQCAHGDGTVESVKWDKLGLVLLQRRRKQNGALLVLIESSEKTWCAVPSTALGCEELKTRLQEFTGVDYSVAVSAALACRKGVYFCWKKADDKDGLT